MLVFLSHISINLVNFEQIEQTQQRVENKKIISQIMGIREVCDQSGDRVSRNDKSCHICSMRVQSVFSKNMKNMGLCLFISFMLIICSVKKVYLTYT